MFNAQKAGLDKVDKDKVNAIIEEASKGTPYWEHQERRNARNAERINEILDRVAKFREKEIQDAQRRADAIVKEIEQSRNNNRIIVHIDMDAFYASVEERDNPELKKYPMAVGGNSMLSTSNYEARKYGVRAGQPGFIAKKLCPNLKIIPGNMEKYSSASKVVMEVLAKYDSRVKVYGLDEAALDITDYCYENNITDIAVIVHTIRNDVFEATQLTCSAGIAPNSMLAKICADVNKPNNQFRLLPDDVKDFMAKLSVRKIPGIGQVQEKVLTALGCETCADLVEKRAVVSLVFSEGTARSYLAAALGACAGYMSADFGKVKSRKSKSAEATFRDSNDLEFLEKALKHLSQRLSEELVEGSLEGKLITLKCKSSTFDTFSRSVALEIATNSQEVIFNHCFKLLKMALSRQKDLSLRLIGVRMSNFEETEHHSGKQLTLTQTMKQSDAMKQESVFPEEATANTCDYDDQSSRDVSSSPFDDPDNNSQVLKEEPEPSSYFVDGNEIIFKDEPESQSDALPEVANDNKKPCVTGVKTEANETLSKQASPPKKSTIPRIEETYCPICAIIMRNVTEMTVNTHIDECLERERIRNKKLERESQQVSNKSPAKKKSKLPAKSNEKRGVKRKSGDDDNAAPSIKSFLRK